MPRPQFTLRALLVAMLAFLAGMAFQKMLHVPVCRFENGSYIMERR